MIQGLFKRNYKKMEKWSTPGWLYETNKIFTNGDRPNLLRELLTSGRNPERNEGSP